MAQYRVAFTATTNSSAAVEDTWLEIFPPANVSVTIKRLLIGNVDTTPSDGYILPRWRRASTAGSGGTAANIIKLRPEAPDSVCTVTRKVTTVAFSLGTLVTEVTVACFNARGIWEWVARDADDMISSDVNQRISLLLRSQAASHDLAVQCDWEE